MLSILISLLLQSPPVQRALRDLDHACQLTQSPKPKADPIFDQLDFLIDKDDKKQDIIP